MTVSRSDIGSTALITASVTRVSPSDASEQDRTGPNIGLTDQQLRSCSLRCKYADSGLQNEDSLDLLSLLMQAQHGQLTDHDHTAFSNP